MNFKKWLKEEEGSGGLGVILILIIIAAAIYAVEIGSSNFLYEPEQNYAEADLISSETDYSAGYSDDSENLNTNHRPVYPMPDKDNPAMVDSVVENPEENIQPVNKPKVSNKPSNKTGTSPTAKAKTKSKPKRNLVSSEDLVKRKLKQGKTVRQIAEETGLNRKYIREVKRRNQQVIW